MKKIILSIIVIIMVFSIPVSFSCAEYGASQKYNIDEFLNLSSGKNLFNINANSADGLTVQNNTIIIDSSAYFTELSYYLKVLPGKQYRFRAYQEIITSTVPRFVSFIFYDIDKKLISETSTNSITNGYVNQTLNIPSDCYFVKFRFARSFSINEYRKVVYSEIQFELGSTATAYEPFYLSNTDVFINMGYNDAVQEDLYYFYHLDTFLLPSVFNDYMIGYSFDGSLLPNIGDWYDINFLIPFIINNEPTYIVLTKSLVRQSVSGLYVSYTLSSVIYDEVSYMRTTTFLPPESINNNIIYEFDYPFSIYCNIQNEGLKILTVNQSGYAIANFDDEIDLWMFGMGYDYQIDTQRTIKMTFDTPPILDASEKNDWQDIIPSMLDIYNDKTLNIQPVIIPKGSYNHMVSSYSEGYADGLAEADKYSYEQGYADGYNSDAYEEGFKQSIIDAFPAGLGAVASIIMAFFNIEIFGFKPLHILIGISGLSLALIIYRVLRGN